MLSFPERQAQFDSSLGAAVERDAPGPVAIRRVKDLVPDHALVE